jgi:3-oxoacyl-[acyl-carrier protein] reductase
MRAAASGDEERRDIVAPVAKGDDGRSESAGGNVSICEDNRQLLLDGKLAVVTGARDGIGRSIALACARAGADVAIVTSGALTGAAQVVGELKALGRRAAAFRADVTRGAEVEALFAAIGAEFGAIDVLVNNAGGFSGGPLEQLSEKAWDDVFALNTKSVFLCSAAACRAMAGRGGAIVNIAGASGHRTFPRGGAFGPAKAAVLAVTKQMALEWADRGVRVNCVSPGPIREPGTGWESREPVVAREVQRLPLRRAGTGEEVAQAVVFLASDQAAYITGHAMPVDGGGVLTWYLWDSRIDQ